MRRRDSSEPDGVTFPLSQRLTVAGVTPMVFASQAPFFPSVVSQSVIS